MKRTVKAAQISDASIKNMELITVRGVLQGTIPCPGGAEIVLLVRVPVAETVEVGSDE